MGSGVGRGSGEVRADVVPQFLGEREEAHGAQLAPRAGAFRRPPEGTGEGACGLRG